MQIVIRAFFILFLIIPCSISLAETTSENKAPSPQDLESWQHFSILVNTISTMRTNLESLRAEIRTIQDEHEREGIDREIDQLQQDLQSLNTALEMLATGGADLSLFGVKVDKPFNLRDELLSIFEPILVELRRLSERPRKIERLRSDLLYFQQRLDVANEALHNLTNYREKAPTPELKNAFKSLENRWQRRHDDLTNRVNLTQFELDQVLSPENKSKQDTYEALKKLFGGRILNLLIAVLVMVGTYILLSLTAKLYRRIMLRDSKKGQAFITRVGSLSFYLLTTIVVMLAGMSVFYIRGDWVLLGLFLIILAGAAWAIQKSLPRYLIEAKLILNLGPVREGERLIYQNLPWQVSSLNFSAILNNPLLQGGTLRIPIKDLVGYNSRRYEANEPWFPSTKGDWIILADNTYGEVLQQTPEVVEIKSLGAIKTYPVGAYLENSPYNLSRKGFTLLLEFGLDYQHQNRITSEILEVLRDEIKTGLQQSKVGQFIQNFSLQFSKADASSLNYVAELSFSGEAAGLYLELPRIFQQLMVESCNRHQWVIPFNQITVHTV